MHNHLLSVPFSIASFAAIAPLTAYVIVPFVILSIIFREGGGNG
ncbi:hypothetical protein J2766_003415 [Agrobacterium tumefaciens]|uniref:Photosystem I reaction center subunit VIII n=1 Tax=Agrobacterium tumefaciens TaxID=358 RepID=A0AAW8LGB9_AGRTU|nr:hypothetical protein [Agrobacterium tumefaciens]MBP2566818.1 hypothetical protein [Agrobacterium tumefaciens]MDR6700723.1 hypothetical protein [Agrobacterium tumefaciens]